MFSIYECVFRNEKISLFDNDNRVPERPCRYICYMKRRKQRISDRDKLCVFREKKI